MLDDLAVASHKWTTVNHSVLSFILDRKMISGKYSTEGNI